MKCPYCGEELGINNTCMNMTCSHVNSTFNFSEDSTLNEPVINISESVNKSFSYSDDISEEELTTFIGGNNTNYYLKYIDKHKTNKRFLSWNWPCFFLSNYWLLYRKLYVPAVILISLIFASSQLFRFKTQIFLLLILHAILGLFANSMYLNNCERKIKKIRTDLSISNIQEYMSKLHKKGGINWIVPLIFLIICALGIMIYIIILLTTMANRPNFSSPSQYF